VVARTSRTLESGFAGTVRPVRTGSVSQSYRQPAAQLSDQHSRGAGSLERFPAVCGYSTSNTLINALRLFPQFSTITVTGSPTGNTYFDSVQMKVTKRMSKGLQANLSYTFSKALTSTRQDIFNPASSTKSIQSTDQPHVLAINFLYQTQTYFTNHLAALITRDWQFGSFLQYASGVPLTPPVATTTNNLPGGSEMYRTGQPLYLKDLNCHCFDPTHEPVAAGIVRKHLQPHVSGGAYHVESTGAAGQERLRAADRRLRRHQ